MGCEAPGSIAAGNARRGPLRRTFRTFATVITAFARLADLGIVEEKTGGQRNRVFAYKGHLGILNEGTEPI